MAFTRSSTSFGRLPAAWDRPEGPSENAPIEGGGRFTIGSRPVPSFLLNDWGGGPASGGPKGCWPEKKKGPCENTHREWRKVEDTLHMGSQLQGGGFSTYKIRKRSVNILNINILIINIYNINTLIFFKYLVVFVEIISIFGEIGLFGAKIFFGPSESHDSL